MFPNDNEDVYLYFNFGEPVDEELPEAMGNGTIAYEMSQELMEDGLTYSSSNNRISGTPPLRSPQEKYVLTATNDLEETASIDVYVTVLDVGFQLELSDEDPGLARSNLMEDKRWEVFKYGSFRLAPVGADQLAGTADFRYRVKVASETGVQVRTHVCSWDSYLRAGDFWTPWVQMEDNIKVVRCAVGSGESVEFEVQVDDGVSGTPKEFTHTEVAKRAPHVDSATIKYWIANPFMGNATPDYISGANGNSDYDENERAEIRRQVNQAEGLVDSAAIIWNETETVQFMAATSEQAADVVIQGLWRVGGENDSFGVVCQEKKERAGACVINVADGNSHYLEQQTMPIAFPADFYSIPSKLSRWTDNWEEAKGEPEKFYYLPGVLVHEFGHVAGLGHSSENAGEVVMNPRTEAPWGPLPVEPTPYDVDGMMYLYDDHSH